MDQTWTTNIPKRDKNGYEMVIKWHLNSDRLEILSQKMDQKRTKNGPKTGQKRAKNGPKTDQKQTKNRPKTDQKATKNGPKRDQ